VVNKPGERQEPMKHVNPLTKTPARAADIPVDVKINFIIAILTAFAPILGAKDPQQG